MTMSRVFNRYLMVAMVGVWTSSHHIRLNRAHKEDLLVWERFLDSKNGRSLWMEQVTTSFDFELFTDAAGSAGYGAYFQSR